MARVAVLPGGGSRGAWQVGCLAAQSCDYDAIHGVSVGACNGVRLAQYATTREAVRALELDWLNTSTASVLASWPAGALSAAVEGSLYSTAPLAALVRRRIAQRPLIKPMVVHACSLSTGALARFELGRNVERDVRAILASAAFPGAMPPVEIDGDLFFDGGLVRVAPLIEALTEYPTVDAIDVYLCDSPHSPVDLWHPRKGLAALLRAVTVATHDRARTDMLDAQALWRELPADTRPEVRLWWPSRQWIDDVMDFSPSLTERALRQGRDDGQRGPKEVWL